MAGLNNIGDLQTQVLVRNGRSTSTLNLSDTVLQSWTQSAHTWAASQHKWPFSEGRISTTFAATEEWNFEGYKADSFRIVTIGGSRLKKLNYEDYLIYREEEPSGTERVFSNIGRVMVINPNIDLSGTLTAYGQYQPAPFDFTDLTAKTIFSDYDEEGNEAIVLKMTSYLKDKDSKSEEAQTFDKAAAEKLEEMWKRILDEQFKYQTHPDRGGMFNRIDVINGGIADEIFKRDQF